MRRMFGVLLALGCAAQPRTARPAHGPYKDVPVAVMVAAGTGSAAATIATAAVVTVAVGTVVVGAEQFPDPPAGTPSIDTAPNDPPNLCRGCLCFAKGLGPNPLSIPREVPGGSGIRTHDTRATCQADCKYFGYNGFQCSKDKTVTWFN